MNEKLKKILWTALAIGVVIAVAITLLFNDLEHIEDTNGTDNYKLQQITNEDIIDFDMGSIGGPNIKESLISDMQVYYSNKFTGVAEISYEEVIANRYEVSLYNTTVEKGNFKIVLVENDEIVHEFELNETMQSFVLEDVSGYVALRIAGESADFSFSYSIS